MIQGGHQRAANKCTTQGQGLHLEPMFAIRRIGKSQSFHGQVSESDGTEIHTRILYLFTHTRKVNLIQSQMPDVNLLRRMKLLHPPLMPGG